MIYSENSLIEQPAITLFAELGWEAVVASEEVPGLSSALGREFKFEVAQALGRQWIGCELNPEYAPLQQARTAQAALAI